MSASRRCCVPPSGRVQFRCSTCQRMQVLEVEDDIATSTPLRTFVRCSCGCVSTLYLQRRAFRKPVSVAGSAGRPGRHLRRQIQVRDISRTGLCFEHRGGTTYKLGERLEVELDSPQRSRVQALVRVRRTTDSTVGAEFVQSSRAQAFVDTLLAPTEFRKLSPAAAVEPGCGP